ncbi:MAG: tRNA1(Val) (adenine(37)-N6)-methyltransferase [Bacteroidia bacterium]
MKISSVACVFGAWADIKNSQNLLDIGTGTGLLALMSAQRAEKAHITALEIEEDAATQAQENVEDSPFYLRIEVIQADITQWFEGKVAQFDTIICNPPFFENQVQSVDKQRSMARHQQSFSPKKLLAIAWQLLQAQGKFFLLLAADTLTNYENQLAENSFFLKEKCLVYDNPASEKPFCVMLSLQKTETPTNTSTFYLRNLDKSHHLDCSQLLAEFLIIF